MKKIAEKFKISGMHCVSCALNIDFDLEDLPGVIKASTNYARQESTVEYDPEKLTRNDNLVQIEKTGYSAN